MISCAGFPKLEEANHNQIDVMLNNGKRESSEKVAKGISIMEKLTANKEKLEQAGKGAKKQEKKRKSPWIRAVKTY